MTRTILALLAGLALFSCGTPDPGTGSTGGGSGSTSQTCSEQHSCVNGACTCSSGPNSGSSCCDPADSTCTTNKCTTFCRFCM